jgi:hypothetical protein
MPEGSSWLDPWRGYETQLTTEGDEAFVGATKRLPIFGRRATTDLITIMTRGHQNARR